MSAEGECAANRASSAAVVAEDRLGHYGLHAELDQRHAEEFFAILEPKWSDAAQRQTIERGLALDAHIFD